MIDIVLDRRQQIESQRLYARIFDSSGDGLVITDSNKIIVAINPVFSQMFGYTTLQAVGKSINLLKTDRHTASYFQKMWHELLHHGYWQDEIWTRASDGSIRSYMLGILAISTPGGQVNNFVGLYSDISRHKQSQAKIDFLTHHDALTQLPNRLLARDRTQLALRNARDTNGLLALLVIDIDHFKNINDSLGYSVGDELIQHVSRQLQRCILDTDTLSRNSGDEFLLLLPSLNNNEQLTITLDQIVSTINQPVILADTEITASVSIGIAVYPQDGVDFESIFKAAELAMYRAKENGRNTWQFFTDQMNNDAQERSMLCNNLRKALVKKQFILHYQPQINLASGKLVGVEALLRWEHPVLGNIPPNRFIPVAEDIGIIVQIGEWVLNEACRQRVAWLHAGLPRFSIAVNLSGVQFLRSNIVASVMRALEQSGLDAPLLELELTESILMRNTEQILATVHQLKALGVQLSIDDFGTGFSSLSYLKRFNVDKLKIDQSFVRDMAVDASDKAIVRAIIQLARNLNLTTIAEGVEYGDQYALLQAEQCDEIQGYHIARPMSADDFMRWITQYQASA